MLVLDFYWSHHTCSECVCRPELCKLPYAANILFTQYTTHQYQYLVIMSCGHSTQTCAEFEISFKFWISNKVDWVHRKYVYWVSSCISCLYFIYFLRRNQMVMAHVMAMHNVCYSVTNAMSRSRVCTFVPSPIFYHHMARTGPALSAPDILEITLFSFLHSDPVN